MKRLIHRAVNRLGYRLIKIEPPTPPQEASMRPLFLSLIQGGFEPRCIIDVGANRGIWTRAALKFFPRAKFVMVEPQAELRQYSSDLLKAEGQVKWITAGVGDRTGVLPFHISQRDDSCSFVEGWSAPALEGQTTVDVEVTTLNELARLHCAEGADIVKIDAEGLDLKVLAGASELLGKTDVFLVEAAVFPRAENSLAEVVCRMTAAGYRTVEITDVNRGPRHGITWLCELAFLRDGCTWLDGVQSYE
jgi:FkbM family methyltransferase